MENKVSCLKKKGRGKAGWGKGREPRGDGREGKGLLTTKPLCGSTGQMTRITPVPPQGVTIISQVHKGRSDGRHSLFRGNIQLQAKGWASWPPGSPAFPLHPLLPMRPSPLFPLLPRTNSREVAACPESYYIQKQQTDEPCS